MIAHLPSRWMQLAALLLLASARAAAEEKILYSIDWWITRDGTSTKRYEFQYTGEENLRRVAAYRKAVPGFPEPLLPFLEKGDTAVETRELAPGHWVFVYRGSKKRVANGRHDLKLWLPVIEDPIATYWSPHEGSRYYYDFRPLEVTTQITYRTPWSARLAKEEIRDKVQSQGISGELRAFAVKGSGSEQDGIRIVSTLRSEKFPMLDVHAIQTQWNDYQKWLAQRAQAVEVKP